MSRILVVEDENAMAAGLRHNLEFEGYNVEVADNGADGLQTALQDHFDLILLDVMLPKLSGFDVLRKLRAEQDMTPIIMLTAKSEEIDKVLGLEMGADDYVTKPFGVRELLARVKALLRRSEQQSAPIQDKVTIGRLTVDFQAYTATHDDKEVHLSVREFDILKFLLEHKGETISRDDLLEKIWGYESNPTTRTVDNFILRLRQKIEPNFNQPKYIITVHGLGYKLLTAS